MWSCLRKPLLGVNEKAGVNEHSDAATVTMQMLLALQFLFSKVTEYSTDFVSSEPSYIFSKIICQRGKNSLVCFSVPSPPLCLLPVFLACELFGAETLSGKRLAHSGHCCDPNNTQLMIKTWAAGRLRMRPMTFSHFCIIIDGTVTFLPYQCA